jgi:hypothetical protein
MNAADIAQILKAKPSGKGYRARCPAHKDTHPSLWFTDAVTKKNPTGKLRFQCKAGCEFRDIRYALGIQAKEKGDHSPTKITSTDIDDDPLGQIVRMRKITNLWKRSVPIVEGSPAWTYLVHTRKVISANVPIPAVMREVPDLGYFTSGPDDELLHLGNFPAIITRMDDVHGNIVTLHRTYLRHDGLGKAPVDKAKKLMQSPADGCTDGAAIKLFAPIFDPESERVILGLSEGIESALGANKLFGTPVWAAWSASGLVKVDIPPTVTNLIIFGDNDSSGRKAINDLVDRLKTESPSLRVVIKLPPIPESKFSDG